MPEITSVEDKVRHITEQYIKDILPSCRGGYVLFEIKDANKGLKFTIIGGIW